MPRTARCGLELIVLRLASCVIIYMFSPSELRFNQIQRCVIERLNSTEESALKKLLAMFETERYGLASGVAGESWIYELSGKITNYVIANIDGLKRGSASDEPPYSYEA